MLLTQRQQLLLFYDYSYYLLSFSAYLTVCISSVFIRAPRDQQQRTHVPFTFRLFLFKRFPVVLFLRLACRRRVARDACARINTTVADSTASVSDSSTSSSSSSSSWDTGTADRTSLAAEDSRSDFCHRPCPVVRRRRRRTVSRRTGVDFATWLSSGRQSLAALTTLLHLSAHNHIHASSSLCV